MKFYSTFWSSILQPSFVFVNDSLGLLLSIICCSFMMSWRTCEILLRCSLVTTFWSLIWNPLLIVHVSFQLLFSISLWYFRCFFEIRWLFWRILTCLLKFFVKFYSTFWSSILKPSFVFVNDSLGLLLSIICCCFMMSWRTCEILLWCSLVTTFWSLISNSLLIVHVSFQLLFFISLWYFRCLTFSKNRD